MKKRIYIILLLLPSILLSGCWDRTDIEDIGFNLALAIDPLSEEEERAELEKMKKEMGIRINPDKVRKYKTTFQVAVPSGMAGQEQSGGASKTFFNLSTTDLTSFKMARSYATRRSRPLNFEHIKAIVINHELIREPHVIEGLIDFYIRDHEMRRLANVIIADQPAYHVLEHKLPLEIMPAISIKDIRDNHPRTLQMPPITNVGEVAENIVADHSFILPRVVHHGAEGMKIAGAAVILGKENRMLGWLSEQEVMGYKWVMGKVENAILQVPFEEADNALFVYENLMNSTKVTYKKKDGKPSFHLEIRSEGVLGESWFHNIEIADVKIQEKLEEAVEKRIEKQATEIIKKMQEEFYTDIFKLYRKVRNKDYKFWKEIEDEWDGEDGWFSKAEITVDAKVQLRHYMLNERLE